MFLFVFLSKLFWVILTCFLVPLIFFFNFEVCITFYLVGEENNKSTWVIQKKTKKSFNLGDEPSEMKVLSLKISHGIDLTTKELFEVCIQSFKEKKIPLIFTLFI